MSSSSAPDVSLGQVTINVAGQSVIYWAAERAVVFVRVRAEGSYQSNVMQDVAKAATKIRNAVDNLDSDHSITHWSQSTLSTGSYQDYDSNGKKKGRIYTATTNFEVKFKDFKELGQTVTKWSGQEHVTIDRIDWRLTDKKKASLMVESRKNAVQDAIEKARDYAEALSKSRIRAIQITENSDHGGSGYGEVAAFRGMARSGGNSNADSLNFQPEDVKVSSSIAAKFIGE